ncbi:MAG: hypothetical protein KC668_14765 [Myxococcales bacterium]|nr:hypothetical protein [Myxococcales bacterium]
MSGWLSALGWQDVAAWLVVAGAAGFLLSRFRRRPGTRAPEEGPDVPVSALVRKRRKR